MHSCFLCEAYAFMLFFFPQRFLGSLCSENKRLLHERNKNPFQLKLGSSFVKILKFTHKIKPCLY